MFTLKNLPLTLVSVLALILAASTTIQTVRLDGFPLLYKGSNQKLVEVNRQLNVCQLNNKNFKQAAENNAKAVDQATQLLSAAENACNVRINRRLTAHDNVQKVLNTTKEDLNAPEDDINTPATVYRNILCNDPRAVGHPRCTKKAEVVE